MRYTFRIFIEIENNNSHNNNKNRKQCSAALERIHCHDDNLIKKKKINANEEER